ncbi:MAG TPA: hypothetical protein VGQ83_26985 [Polyangia bacterium]|jgi:hypothetical protein
MRISRLLAGLLLSITTPTAARAAELVIPTDKAPLVFAALPAQDAPLPGTGYRLADAEIRFDHVDVCFAAQGGDRRCVALVHPSRGGAPRTRYFAVVPRSPADAELARVVAGYVTGHEQASPWAPPAAGPP